MPVTSRPHVAAVRGLLTAAGLSVIDGGTAEPAPPCVVLWVTPGTHEDNPYAPATTLTVELTTVCCGLTADQAMWVADKVSGALTGAMPAVTGRTPHRIAQTYAAAVQRDDDVAAGLLFTSIGWQFTTSPA